MLLLPKGPSLFVITIWLMLLGSSLLADSYSLDELEKALAQLRPEYGVKISAKKYFDRGPVIQHKQTDGVTELSRGGLTIRGFSQTQRFDEETIAFVRKIFLPYPRSVLLSRLNQLYLVNGRIKVDGSKHLSHALGVQHQFQGESYIVIDLTRKTAELESVFHHELSHLLHTQRPEIEKEWDRLQKTEGTPYGNFQSNPSPELLAKEGFASDYGTTNFAEDIATHAELYFLKPDQFVTLAKSSPLARKKAYLFIRLYKSIDPSFPNLLNHEASRFTSEAIKSERLTLPTTVPFR